MRAPPRYAAHAVVPEETGACLFDRIDCVRIAPRRIPDLGSGVGGSFAPLCARYPLATLYSADASEAMLRAGRGLSVRRRAASLAVADARALSFADAAFGLLCPT